MSLRNAFACLDDSDEEPAQQVKSKAKAKAPAAAPAPARYNNRRDNNRRDNRGGRDSNRGRGDYNRDSGDRRDNRGGRDNNRGGRGEYNRDAADSGARKYRRDDRRQDRRRDADRRDRRRDGNNQDQRRGRNQYEKSHQKRGPKKGGHGGWGTDKDAVDVTVEETATGAASPDTAPTEEGATDETPSEPAAPAVQELTLEEHEAAEKERRAQFNARWASSAPAASKEDLAKDFSGMAVVSKKTRKTGADIRTANKSRKAASRSAQKAKELKKAIFAEPTHNHGGGDYGDRGRGRGGDRGRGRGGDRGGRGGGRDRRGGRGGGGGDYGYGGRGARGGRDNQRGSGASSRRYDVDTQDVNEFPALS